MREVDRQVGRAPAAWRGARAVGRQVARGVRQRARRKEWRGRLRTTGWRRRLLAARHPLRGQHVPRCMFANMNCCACCILMWNAVVGCVVLFRCGVLVLVVIATSAGGVSSTWATTGCGGMVTVPQVRTAAQSFAHLCACACNPPGSWLLWCSQPWSHQASPAGMSCL